MPDARILPDDTGLEGCGQDSVNEKEADMKTQFCTNLDSVEYSHPTPKTTTSKAGSYNNYYLGLWAISPGELQPRLGYSLVDFLIRC